MVIYKIISWNWLMVYQSNQIFKKIIAIILSWFKVLNLFGGSPYNGVLTCSLIFNCLKKVNFVNIIEKFQSLSRIKMTTQENIFSITSTHRNDCITKIMSKFTTLRSLNCSLVHVKILYYESGYKSLALTHFFKNVYLTLLIVIFEDKT